MKRHFIILFLLVFTSALKAQTKTEEVIQDIDRLYNLIEYKHVAPFWNNSKENILEVVENAKRKIQEKETCDESCYVEIFKIVASLNESHSYVSGNSRYELFGYLPISLKWFEDGLYIIKTSEAYEEILGHKLIAINGTKIDLVIEQMKQVIPHTNPSRIKKYIGSYLHLPGLLYGLGISDNPDEAIFSFEKDGIQIERTIKNLTPKQEEQTTFKTIQKGHSYFQRNQDSYYWFDHDPTQNLVYFQYNRIGNMDSESSTTFAKRLWATVDSVEVDKFVLDLRYNGGGSFPYSLKFIQGIINRPKINKRGKLFVITGYDTFSAAITMVNQLEQRTETIIVGEYPCASPSHPGDPENYKLDNTSVTVSLSSLYHPSFYKEDSRSATILDEHLELFWKDYSKGIDPSLDFIVEYETEGFEIVNSTDYLSSIGTYKYSAIRNMNIGQNNGKLYFKIDEELYTPLYVASKGVFSTEVNGLTLSIKDDSILINFPDGATKQYNKIEKTARSAIDYLYTGEIKKAEEIYLTLKESDPNNIALKDHQLSFLASIIYFDLSDDPNKDASYIAKEILNMGIKLNEGKAPFCEFSLRFY